MLKGLATYQSNGRRVFMLGLSRENLQRLVDQMGDTHILVRGAEVGLEVDVLIFSGETEESMAAQVAQSDTKIHRREKRR